MKQIVFTAALALLVVAAGAAPAEAPMPGVGEKAPDFAMLGSDGRAHSLTAHRGRQPVVLAFFPKAFTAG